MLAPALKYENELKALFLERWYDPKYQYYNTISWREQYKADESNWNKIEMVSVHLGKVIGYFSASVDRDALVVTNISAINFYDVNVVFSKDLARFFRNLFEVFKFRKVRFSVSIGNPIEASYDRMVERYGGQIVGIWKSEDKLLDGTYADRKWYEILREDFLAALLGERTSQQKQADVRQELRALMDSYIRRQEKIDKEIEEAKEDGDVEAELTGEALQRQMKHVIAELFQTMKRLGVLDDEEIEFGAVKAI